MKKLILPILMLVGCGAGDAELASAKPYTLRVKAILIEGAGSPDFLREVSEITHQRYNEQLGMAIKVKELVSAPNTHPELLTLSGFWDRSFYNVVKKQYYKPTRKRRHFTLVYTPPIEGVYIGGWAAGVCQHMDGFALIHTKDHLLKSALVDTHEKGHLAGANHDDSLPATIMHGNAGKYLGEEPDPVFSKKSLREIRKCVNFWKRRNRRWLRNIRLKRRGKKLLPIPLLLAEPVGDLWLEKN